MTRREELMEAYEDAYFALLMEDVAEMEGAALEARREELEKDPSAAVPETVDRRCVRAIERHFARQKRQKYLRTAGRVLNRAAVFVALLSVMLTTVLAVSEDARTAAANLLVTINERYTELHMEARDVSYGPGGKALEDGYFSKIHIGWLPEGFFYTGGTPDMKAIFENDEEHLIIIGHTSGSAALQIDTENADIVDYIEVNGHQVLKVCKDGCTHLVMSHAEKNSFATVFASEGITSETAIKILENISFL